MSLLAFFRLPSIVAVLLLALAAPTSASVSAKDLRILVSDIQSDQGEIICLLFSGEKGFPTEKDRALRSMQYAAVAGLLTCTFADVEPGRYAVAVVHDANGNKEIDTGFTGSIKEPWGITNNARPARRAPKFSDAVIYVGESQPSDYEVILQD
jgi:uncharacterized protein (DUF2141 family)